MNKLSIAVDLDGIVVDLHNRWLELFNEEFRQGATLEDLKHWEMTENFNVGTAIYKYLNLPGFYLALEPLPGAVEALERLHRDGHEIQIISATINPNAAADKLHWCAKHLPFLKPRHLTISHQKYRFVTDVFIDDSPHNIREHSVAQPNALRMGIAWPYNECVSDLMLRARWHRDPLGAWATMVAAINEYSSK